MRLDKKILHDNKPSKVSNDSQSQLTVDKAYTQAIDHFNARRYIDADKLCSAIIQAVPNCIDAINLLGVIAQRVNRHELAVEQFQKAINIDNSRALLYYNLGVSLYTLGRIEEAIQVLRIALEKEPGNGQFIEYLNGLLNNFVSNAGVDSIQNKAGKALRQGISFHKAGQLDEAIHWYQKTLKFNPDNLAALSNMGAALQTTGKLEEAVSSYQKAIAIKPDYAEAYSNIGNAQKEQGKLKEAVISYQKAIAINPDYVKAYYNLGVILQEQGKAAEAVASYQKAIAIKPDYAEVYSNIGNTLLEHGKLEEAVSSYQKAISLKPDCVEAYSNLGYAKQEQGKSEEAVASYQKAMYLRLNHKVSAAIPADFPGSTNFLIELTNRCNFHCSFCPSDAQTRTIGEMSLGLVEKIFNEISSKKLNHTVNIHHMGEPTLFRHLKEVLRLASQCGLKVELVTNGSTLSKGKIDFLLDELSGKLIISLQTPTIDSFKLRGTKMPWENYIGCIQDLIKTYLSRIARGDYLKCQVKIRLMKTFDKQSNVDVLSNKESILNQINFWSDFIMARELHEGLTPYKRQPANTLPDNWFSTRNTTYILHTGITLCFWPNFTFANTIVRQDAQLTFANNAKFCSHPFTDISVLWDGRCVPCCLDYDGQLYIGNANTDSLESILMGAKASHLRRAFLGDGSLPVYCQKCQADFI